MRTDTDTFEQIDDDSFFITAQSNNSDVMLTSFDKCESVHVVLTKDQAREFARQLLELCGDE